ncbi:uncharacterized protein LOC121378388 [Gigantopelta aegis]|uniref:uncharacterized protein LOC121378388 n=1 Tax=Gigantopelta aegis TaxID=1735272 RepID=UPI001B88D5E4|nr:uncharacterized protein LOC121378388 [Gigantopelta aegis]
MQKIKKQLKMLQTKLSHKDKTIKQLRDTKCKLNAMVKKIKQECDSYIVQNEDLKSGEKTLLTKAGNKYSDAVVKCIIQLIGEASVPASRCASVIQCVSKCLFDRQIDIDKLLSERSTLRYADRGHVLAKYHIADSIMKSDRFDMHSDGTSRDHRKYIGSQATLSSGNIFSMGYTTVCTEDTKTLLDISVTLLKELADIYDDDGDSVDQNFKELLQKLSGLMSDRASVNKSFNKAMNQCRQEVLEDNSAQLQFLYCSAHFLLGLSSEGEKVLKCLQKELDGKLGRDQLSIFNSFSSSGESAVSRYIRTACDVLGPRGDEKSGCRDAWEAFCAMKGLTSHIKSYRGNRFNNFFEGAASLHFHRKDIQDFFSNYSLSLNLKLQSVLADCQCDVVDTLIAAVGITYFTVTGPYWNLCTSKTEYLDLYRYMSPMREKFQQYSSDASPLLEDPLSVIPEFSVEGGEVVAALMEVPDRKLLLDTLQKLFSGFLAVTDRQLADFLPSGKYYDIQDPILRQKMRHCQLTNLTGEQNLGDLDYSLFVKRHASLHYRSFTNMMSRNKTMSSWFHKKTAVEQRDLLSMSKSKSEPLRLKHKDVEKAILCQRQEKLLMNQKQLEEKRLKVIKRKSVLSETVKQQGGPCLCPNDVDTLLKNCSTKTAAKVRLNAEIQYQKVVLGTRNNLLKSAKLSNDEVADNLKKYLAGVSATDVSDVDSLADEFDVPETDVPDVPETDVPETDVPESASASGAESDLDDDGLQTIIASRFRFSSQGTWVGVFYDGQSGPDYFIGQVIDLSSTESGRVTFLEKCGLKKNLFRFPASADIDTVSADYVFSSGFDVTTKNGRTWSVTSFEEVEKLFQQYVELYC